ncbi:DUF952 domain-containing protein [Planktothrix sp. FACHB-1355]|uniref:DUF952 domain-containing protein n=1 Tax=Aerosakkonema funiforme FACHB-1375 TaxID=2949571 RepID=A0A926VJX6_9CYAN|nr:MULTISPECIES: DUF952 domain-containing protein [Oscillatoriales]MBD2185083.1 DUF952 domain-containing protein [Aerosakkonema funiforme FACHB-1375]MBD3559148.1 DUF952 domain-containing protein [Planktothrix sp. FACHB-1355]
MKIILHITKREQWEQAQLDGFYKGDTLETEGFIHCSTPHQVVKTANKYFDNQKGLVILWIESDKVRAEIRYEGVGEEHYPHIYGILNIDAVTQVLDFEPLDNGEFELPTNLGDTMKE